VSTVLDPAGLRRSLARSDCIDWARRAASAAAAASNGETDPIRAAALADAHRRLRGVIRELQELA
jgi:hypothetical protein